MEGDDVSQTFIIFILFEKMYVHYAHTHIYSTYIEKQIKTFTHAKKVFSNQQHTFYIHTIPHWRRNEDFL